MDKRLLNSFVVLAEELHFIRAAGRLRITQSALSQQISRLEQEIGVQLFDRSRRRVSLTDAGQSLFEEGSLALRQLNLAIDMAKRAANGHVGSLTIGFADAAALNVLPKLTSEFSKRYPGVNIILHEMISAEQVEALRARRIQIALLRPVFEDGDFDTALLLREPYVVAVSATHKLADCDTIRLADLSDEGLITTRRVKARYVEENFRPFLKRAGVTLRTVQEVNELHAILGLVAGGLGIALFPRSITSLQLDGVVFRPLDGKETPTAEMYIAKRSDDETMTVRRFVELAKKLHGQAK
ncbi:LysR family transcriptional regulator [Rhizobium wenxiniae]|uniref:LysR substrate-binding domain-containing protein n=1 Tax=Rhizobium wenxiniae TaxID=1737357 RepID=UPI001C6F385A|nr:LysR substrate-binding domain-containing protein [Rhizobium wenxiniae]MBW9089801.1 LysR family transcriptional regulator [Rhizobium wenxiniae]